MFLSHYYLKLITIPTRVTQSSATLLDNIYTTDPMNGQNGVLTSDFSDHFSIFTIRQNMEPKIPDTGACPGGGPKGPGPPPPRN